jgi:hypothetical protein
VLAPGSIESGGGIGRPGNGSTSECDGNVLEGTKTQGRNGFQQLATAAETTDSLVEQRLEGAHLSSQPLRRGTSQGGAAECDVKESQSATTGAPHEELHRAGVILVMTPWDPYLIFG